MDTYIYNKVCRQCPKLTDIGQTLHWYQIEKGLLLRVLSRELI